MISWLMKKVTKSISLDNRVELILRLCNKRRCRSYMSQLIWEAIINILNLDFIILQRIRCLLILLDLTSNSQTWTLKLPIKLILESGKKWITTMQWVREISQKWQSKCKTINQQEVPLDIWLVVKWKECIRPRTSPQTSKETQVLQSSTSIMLQSSLTAQEKTSTIQWTAQLKKSMVCLLNWTLELLPDLSYSLTVSQRALAMGTYNLRHLTSTRGIIRR